MSNYDTIKLSRRYSDPDQYDLLLATCTNPRDREFVLDRDRKNSRINSEPKFSIDSANFLTDNSKIVG